MMRNRINEWLVPKNCEPSTIGLEEVLAGAVEENDASKRDRMVVDFAARECLQACAYQWAETASRRMSLLNEFGVTYKQMLRLFEIMRVYQVDCDFAAGLATKGTLVWVLQVAPSLIKSNRLSRDITTLITSFVMGCHLNQTELENIKIVMIQRCGLFSRKTTPELLEQANQVEDQKQESKCELK